MNLYLIYIALVFIIQAGYILLYGDCTAMGCTNPWVDVNGYLKGAIILSVIVAILLYLKGKKDVYFT